MYSVTSVLITQNANTMSFAQNLWGEHQLPRHLAQRNPKILIVFKGTEKA